MGELGLLAQALNDAAMTGNARLDGAFCEAMNNKDVDGAMRCFLDSPDLVVVLHGTVVRGPVALRQFLGELFSSMRTIGLEINDIDYRALGETILALGLATYHFESMDGGKSTLKGRWTDARQKVGGKWVYVLDHVTRIR